MSALLKLPPVAVLFPEAVRIQEVDNSITDDATVLRSS